MNSLRGRKTLLPTSRTDGTDEEEPSTGGNGEVKTETPSEDVVTVAEGTSAPVLLYVLETGPGHVIATGDTGMVRGLPPRGSEDVSHSETRRGGSSPENRYVQITPTLSWWTFTHRRFTLIKTRTRTVKWS